MNDFASHNSKKPTRVVTKYGAVHLNGDMEHLDKQEFLNWVKEYRLKYNETSILPETNEAWVILWKHTLAKDYGEKAFNLVEKFS